MVEKTPDEQLTKPLETFNEPTAVTTFRYPSRAIRGR
jgi:hypothetical protein